MLVGAAARRRRLHGHGRRGEHRRAAADGGAARRRAGRSGHARRHRRRRSATRRVGPCAPGAGRSRSRRGWRSRRWRRPGRRPRQRAGAVHRPRRRAGRCSSTASASPSTTAGRSSPQSRARVAWARAGWPRRLLAEATVSLRWRWCSAAGACPTASPTRGARSPAPSPATSGLPDGRPGRGAGDGPRAAVVGALAVGPGSPERAARHHRAAAPVRPPDRRSTPSTRPTPAARSCRSVLAFLVRPGPPGPAARRSSPTSTGPTRSCSSCSSGRWPSSAGQPFALLTTARPCGGHSAARARAATTRRALRARRRSTAGAAGELVRALLGGEVDRGGRGRAARPQRRQPAVPRGAGRDGAASAARVGELPDTLRGLVAARLDELVPRRAGHARERRRARAVGHVDGACRSSARRPRPDAAAARRSAALADAELLDVDGDEWVFRSESVRDVAYQTLTKAARAQRHAGVADAIVRSGHGGRDRARSPTTTRRPLASSHELGRVPGVPADIDDRAVRWLTLAAERDLDSSSTRRCAQRAEQAIELLDLAGAPASRSCAGCGCC